MGHCFSGVVAEMPCVDIPMRYTPDKPKESEARSYSGRREARRHLTGFENNPCSSARKAMATRLEAVAADQSRQPGAQKSLSGNCARLGTNTYTAFNYHVAHPTGQTGL